MLITDSEKEAQIKKNIAAQQDYFYTITRTPTMKELEDLKLIRATQQDIVSQLQDDWIKHKNPDVLGQLKTAIEALMAFY